MFFPRRNRFLKTCFDVIAAGIVGLLSYLFLSGSFKGAVQHYFADLMARQEAGSYISLEIKAEIESLMLWAAGWIAVFMAVLFMAGVLLARLRSQVKKSQNTLKNAVDAANIIIMILDRDGNVLEFNKHAQKLYDEINDGKTTGFLKLLSEKDAEKIRKRMKFPDLSGMSPHFELRLKSDAGYRHLYCSLKPAVSEDGNERFELLAVDITDRARKEIELKESHQELTAVYEKLAASEEALRAQLERINRLAYMDPLTGLPNKISLAEKFAGQLANNRSQVAFILIDLDDFRLVNETYGHLAGDRILVETAERLKGLAGENMFLARLGADEFAILAWDFGSSDFLSALAERIAERIDGFINIDKTNISISASIGITLYPQDASSFDELYKNAEMAMYKAKDKKCRYLFYHREFNDAVVERLNLINYLKGALDNGELRVIYQPQYDIRNGKIVGLEALLRWENSRLGAVPPSRFIPVAEETRLIIPIGEFVLKTSLAFLRKLRDMGHGELMMCVNISIIQLMQKDFTRMVLDLLEEHGIPTHLLELEITESVMLETSSTVLENIRSLRDAGVKIALDDFGTGYSSLNYLMHLPINTLKIDRSFIENIGRGRDKELLISTIMNIGRKLGLSTVAEGVEHREQLEYLKKRKCERVQGFLLSRPLSPADTELLLAGVATQPPI